MSFHRKLLSTTLTLSLNTILSTRISKKYFVSSLPILERTHSSGLKCFHLRNEWWLQRLHSSVLGSPHLDTSNVSISWIIMILEHIECLSLPCSRSMELLAQSTHIQSTLHLIWVFYCFIFWLDELAFHPNLKII